MLFQIREYITREVSPTGVESEKDLEKLDLGTLRKLTGEESISDHDQKGRNIVPDGDETKRRIQLYKKSLQDEIKVEFDASMKIGLDHFRGMLDNLHSQLEVDLRRGITSVLKAVNWGAYERISDPV
jgi:hypothetical protein